MPGVKTYLNLITLPHLYSIGQTSGTTLVYPPYGEKNYQRLLIVMSLALNHGSTTSAHQLYQLGTNKIKTGQFIPSMPSKVYLPQKPREHGA